MSPLSVLIVMGVSGSGKTTIAQLLAGRLGWAFEEGDDFHPRANVEKMQSGHPLTDADRAPWLAAIAAEIDALRARGARAVITCSALKRAYRRELAGGRDDVRLVYLKGSRALIEARIKGRQGHFMPASLLDSQFETLEEPGSEEFPITVEIDAGPEAIVDRVLAVLKPACATLGEAGRPRSGASMGTGAAAGR